MGQYIGIVNLEAPTLGAAQGSQVSVSWGVQNNYTTPIYIACTLVAAGATQVVSPESHTVEPYAWGTFTSGFIMPGYNAEVVIAAFYWTGETWEPDDNYTFIIPLITTPPHSFDDMQGQFAAEVRFG